MTTASGSGPGLLLVNVGVPEPSAQRFTRRKTNAVRITRRRGAQALQLESDVNSVKSAGARIIDCQGLSLLPGFRDAHCHVMAYASSLLAVNCRPPAVSSIADIKHAILGRANMTPRGDWVRATGYHESDLSAKRHPTRWDLDEVSPSHPVRLLHRSGHAMVLNSLALAVVGISNTTDEPPGGTIDRDPVTGEPSGLLLEMADFVGEKMPMLSPNELRDGMRLASDKFLSYGVTAVCDTSPQNSPETFTAFKNLQKGGHFLPSLTMMAGQRYLDDFMEESLRMGVGTEPWTIGHVKIMLTMSNGNLSMSQNELVNLIDRAHTLLFPVAIHCVEEAALVAALDALKEASPLPSTKWKDRIEHCSECPPELMSKMVDLGVVVATNPAFLYNSGDRYLAETERYKLGSLYRAKSLLNAGLQVMAGSDAPVTEPNPMTGIYSAMTRRTAGGRQVNGPEGLNLNEALLLYGSGIDAGPTGFIPNNLVLLDRPLNQNDPDEILKTKVVMTIRNREIAYEA